MARKIQQQQVKIEPTEIPLTKLVPAIWNYKKDNQKLTRKLINNIKRNGQIETVCVRELDNGYFEVINGNHRLDAFRYLGYEKVFAYNLGKISETQAKRIAIELNETRFESDGILLSQTLSDIISEFNLRDVVETIPFDSDALAQFQLVVEPEVYINEASNKESNQKEQVPFKVDNKITLVRITPELDVLLKKVAERMQIAYERGMESFFLIKVLEHFLDIKDKSKDNKQEGSNEGRKSRTTKSKDTVKVN